MKHFLTPFLLALAFVASAQTVTLDITWRDTTVIGADMTYAQAKTRWPAWVGYMEYIGASSRVLNIRKAVAAHNNAVWANDDYQGVTFYPNGCGSRVNIIWPHGAFLIDAELIQPQGMVKGQGTGGFIEYDQNGKMVLRGSSGTTLIYDHSGWDGVGNHAGYGGDASKRFIFKDQTWGRVDNFGYTEGARKEGFKILGQSNDLYDPSYHFSAVGAWKRGEVSADRELFIYSCNNFGIELGGQFHATYTSWEVSIFKCGLGAYGVIGGAHMQVFMGSWDDEPSVFYVRPDSKGSIGNGTVIKVHGQKQETGKTDARPYSRGLVFVDSEDSWTQFDGYGLVYSKVNSVPFELARYKDRPDKRSTFNLWGITWFDQPAHMLSDVNKGIAYKMDGGFASAVVGWFWNSVSGVTFSPGVTLQAVPLPCQQRLAPLPRDPMTGGAVGNWVGCSPLYSYTTPIASEGGPVQPPPTTTPCTYTYSNWSTCTNGRQTRTVVSATPAGCTGTPGPLEQACTVAPTVVRWASTFSGTNGCTLVATTGTSSTQSTSWACGTVRSGALTTNRCTSFPLAMPATRVVYVGVTFTSWEDWGWLNSAIRTRADGTLIDGSGKVLATVTRGTKIDRLVLDLLPGTTLQSVIGPADRNTCGTAVMTVESVELY